MAQILDKEIHTIPEIMIFCLPEEILKQGLTLPHLETDPYLSDKSANVENIKRKFHTICKNARRS